MTSFYKANRHLASALEMLDCQGPTPNEVTVAHGCRQWRSQEMDADTMTHYQYVGNTLQNFTKADVRTFERELLDVQSFRSEFSIEDVQAQMSVLSDKVRDKTGKFTEQLGTLVKLIKLLGEEAVNDYLKFDGNYWADLLSQVLMALKLIAAEPTVTNLTLVFTCCITKFNLSKEQYEKVLHFIHGCVESAVASVRSVGFKSESAVSEIIDVLSSMCSKSAELLNDKVIDIVVHFISKLVAFWATMSGGFSELDFKLESMPKVVDFIREILASGGDIIEALMGTYEFVTENFTQFIKGDFTALFMGKVETAAYETRVARANKCYALLKSGSHDILKEEYGFTPSGFDAEVNELIQTGERYMKKAKPQQRPALKRMLEELREVQTDRFIKNAQVQTKPSAFGLCFVGGSGVGKSLLMAETAKTLIQAAGEVPTDDRVVTGQMSDKFDSNEMPHHLVIMYDDVANNSSNENFDKLLNAVNSQSRPFLKASVEEKGIMFPGNVGCIISTNVLGINAHKSNCPDSIGRRFLHITVSIKESVKKEVCTPGTSRVDVKLAMKDGPRWDIWKFEVFDFVTFNPDGEIPDGVELVEHDGQSMYARRVKWTDKPESEYTYWDLAIYLGKRAQSHYKDQKGLVTNLLNKQQEDRCEGCFVPMSVCQCGSCKSEFISGDYDVGIERVVAQYNVMHDYLSSWYNMAKFRAALGLAVTFCPVNLKKTGSYSTVIWLAICCLFRLSFVTTIGCTMLGVTCTILWMMYNAWRRVYTQIATRAGILSHLAEETKAVLRSRRKELFIGAGVISFAYMIYRTFRPRSQQISYRDQLPENIRASFARAEKARTTPIDNIMPHMKRDLGVITVKTGSRIAKCLAFPVHANFYLTAGHIIPDEDCEITIVHENALNPTVSKQLISRSHVKRFDGKDLVLVQVPSAIPRRGYLEFLNGKDQYLGSQAVHLVSMSVNGGTRYTSATRINPGWSMLRSTVSTDKVTLQKPYQYLCPMGTEDGMCGSLIVDYSKSLIYGFHVAGNGDYGLCSTISREMIIEALDSFKGFIPANRGELDLGSQNLERGLGFAELQVGDETVDQAVEDHNCIIEGVLPQGSASFKDPYMKHPYYKDVVEEFGETTSAPPQDVNHPFHKRKALTKLTSPNQEFSLDEVEFARLDYVDPILAKIRQMPASKVCDLKRPLSIQEALDGISEKSLGGIDNSTSVGFPYKGKKMNYLARDPLDVNLPRTPRELVPYNGVEIKEEVAKMIDIYRSGKTCRPLFKCSMKTNELLPKHKFKARVFMGSNFPFLLVCRMYLAPFIRLASREKYLFESAKGINMDSQEAEDLYNYLVENEERIVALDYSAFDQTMSVQVSSAVSACIMDIMQEMGCSAEHLAVVRGILTDINYPNLHFFGTLLQLANSDPSGNPITTELNGGVNSIYLRIFFYRIYPHLKGKVTYRQAIKSMTYGDDNISSVPEKYSDFNGTNIVRVGKECGLTITMADKDAAITDFTHLEESDFLKRKFRYCPDMKRIRAPLAYESIIKSLYYMKKTSPDPPEVLFAQNVDGALRKASQHGRQLFEEIKSKLLTIATRHGVVPICKWWGYDELIQHDLVNYYSGTSASLAEKEMDPLIFEEGSGFKSESWTHTTKPKVGVEGLYILFGKLAEMAIAVAPVVKAGRFADIGTTFSTFFTGMSLLTIIQWLYPVANVATFDKMWWSRLGHSLRTGCIDLWLSRENDIIRPQPYAIALEGPPGVGKTTLALALVKMVKPNIKKHEIVVLNEEDDFQSEFRSHHKVVILDDVANTKMGLLAVNPLRRVIDFVNNVPKRALSPEADLKGVIKIQPELVILTTNVPDVAAVAYSNCPESIWRRLMILVVKMKPNYRYKGDGLDLNGWDLSYKPMVPRGGSTTTYTGFSGPGQPVSIDFNTLVERLRGEIDDHDKAQVKLVHMVNAMFDEPSLWEKIVTAFPAPKWKSQSWDEDLTLGLSDLPQGASEEEILLRIEQLAFSQAASGRYTNEELPDVFKVPEPLGFWARTWQALLVLLGIIKFKSESEGYMPSFSRMFSSSGSKSPALTADKVAMIKKFRSHVGTPTETGYIVNDRYILTITKHSISIEVLQWSNNLIGLISWVNSTSNGRFVTFDKSAFSFTGEDVQIYDREYGPVPTMAPFKSESLDLSDDGDMPIPTRGVSKDELLEFVIADKEFLKAYLDENLDEVIARHYVFINRKMQQRTSNPLDASQASPLAGLAIDPSFSDDSTDVSPLGLDLGGNFDLLGLQGFSNIGGRPLRVPHDQEFQAQCLAHMLVKEQFPEAILVAHEVQFDSPTWAIDLVYKLGNGYMLVEAKHKRNGLVKQAKQNHKRLTKMLGKLTTYIYNTAEDKLEFVISS